MYTIYTGINCAWPYSNRELFKIMQTVPLKGLFTYFGNFMVNLLAY